MDRVVSMAQCVVMEVEECLSALQAWEELGVLDLLQGELHCICIAFPRIALQCTAMHCMRHCVA